MRVLGIDQSYTSTGYCLLDEEHNILECGLLSSDKAKTPYERAHEMALKVGEVTAKLDCDMVGVEGLPFNMMGNQTRNLAGLQFAIIIHLQQHLNKEVHVVNPKSMKLFAFGKGTASKDDLYNVTPNITKKLFEEKGYKKTKGRSDVVDAYWIARYLLKENP